jgi:hypothetical protein
MSWYVYDSTGSLVTGVADGSITNAKMAANSIDSDQYVDGSIDAAHLAADVITGAKIADDAIDSEHYTDASIDTAHIANLQITTGLIAADAVTGAKIADDAIDSEHYTDGSIDNAHIADDAIDSEHYAAASIDTAHIANLQITTALIAADAVTAAKIGDDVIDSEHYADGSIDTAHIADNQVTLAKMAGITRGSFIIGDASGDPSALAKGTENYVLTAGADDIAWAAAAGGPSQANQAALEAETDEDTYIPPDLLHFSPAVAKYWSTWEMSGEHDEAADYGGGSVTDGLAVGNTRHTFGVTFSSVNYAAVTSAGSGGYFLAVEASTRATTGVNTNCHAHDATATDISGASMAVFGDL